MSRESWQNLYFVVSGVVFLLVALFHFLRLAYDWPIVVSSVTIPMWLSYIGLPVSAGYCAWACWLLATRNKA